jgi:hypothetical protein
MSEPADSTGSRGEGEGPASPYGGLCARCRHVRTLRSNKGSVFVLCGLAKLDPRFPRYPPQPVLRCSGFDPRSAETRPG